jgi:hypothetical protein
MTAEENFCKERHTGRSGVATSCEPTFEAAMTAVSTLWDDSTGTQGRKLTRDQYTRCGMMNVFILLEGVDDYKLLVMVSTT